LANDLSQQTRRQGVLTVLGWLLLPVIQGERGGVIAGERG
jgi:hypothetical protein